MRAQDIASCLARGLFMRDLVVVDQCSWPGDECDLLVLTKRLQVIDVEIKISRADLRRDRAKSKWSNFGEWVPNPNGIGGRMQRTAREWPRRVWKHYFAMPATLFKPDLLDLIPEPSGILTVDDSGGYGPDTRGRERAQARNPKHWRFNVVKRARGDRAYQPVTPSDVCAIARLASLRMWDAYHEISELARDQAPPAKPDAVDALEQFIRAHAALPKSVRDAIGGDRRLELILQRARHMQQYPQIPPRAETVEGELMPRESAPARLTAAVPARRQGKTAAAQGAASPLVLQPSPDKTGARPKRIRRSS